MLNRQIILKGTRNFRDIGGYSTNEGKTIKTGMIYRSAHLAKLSKSDIKIIDKLNLKVILDLRSQHEIEHSPSRLPSINPPKTQVLPLQDPNIDTKKLYKKMLAGKLGDFDFKEYLLSQYRRYVTECQTELETLFECLLDAENYPILILCNGGKDRTGTVVALIHFALGVSRETVFQDYMLTKKCLETYIKRVMIMIKLTSLFRANLKQISPVLDTNADYLQEALNAIEKQYNSMDAFLDTIGMNKDARTRFSNILCS